MWFWLSKDVLYITAFKMLHRGKKHSKLPLWTLGTGTVFLYCCAGYSSCLTHMNSLGWATWAAIKKYCLEFLQVQCDSDGQFQRARSRITKNQGVLMKDLSNLGGFARKKKPQKTEGQRIKQCYLTISMKDLRTSQGLTMKELSNVAKASRPIYMLCRVSIWQAFAITDQKQ